jgi:hypothetical protein
MNDNPHRTVGGSGDRVKQTKFTASPTFFQASNTICPPLGLVA